MVDRAEVRVFYIGDYPREESKTRGVGKVFEHAWGWQKA